MSVMYQPDDFPPKNLDWKRLVPLIGPAHAALAQHGAYIRALPNKRVLVSALFAYEAVISCGISGRQTSLGDVFEYEAGSNNDSNEEEIKEIQNYRKALIHAMNKRGGALLLTEGVLKSTHKVLLKGARGSQRDPGNYRRVPVRVGPYDPCPAGEIGNRMRIWEGYMNSDDCPDKLVQLALVHAEFEAIHPFLDGNGRLGRLLVPLYFVEKGLLGNPIFNISEYLQTRRKDYEDGLLAVSRDNDWTGWCEFFLTGIESQANSSHAKIKAMHDLYENCKRWIIDNRLSTKAIAALDFFFYRPQFTKRQLAEKLGVSKPTAARLIDKFIEAKFIREWRSGGGRRPSILIFPKLPKIFF